MIGNFHVPFLGGLGAVMPLGYPVVCKKPLSQICTLNSLKKGIKMPSTKKRIQIVVTDNEYENLQKLMATLNLNQSETIRHCIVAVCNQNGIKAEDNMPKRGTYRRED